MFSRDNNAYKAKSRYSELHIGKTIISIVNALVTEDIVCEQKDFNYGGSCRDGTCVLMGQERNQALLAIRPFRAKGDFDGEVGSVCGWSE